MTTKLIHSSPLGGLEIPGVLGAVVPGEPFDIDDDLARSLLEQTDLFREATAKDVEQWNSLQTNPYSGLGIKDLAAHAEERGIVPAGKKKSDYVAALLAADSEGAPA